MTAPADAEVLLFGPGYGECALVHLGLGDWMIIDSCRARGVQPALDHLRRVGAKPETDVRIVVASHWHDDHVAGLAEVVATCQSATFVSSLALSRQEFLALVLAARTHADARSGMREFAQIVGLLDDRQSAGEPAAMSEWAVADKRVWSRFEDPHAEVWVLSPSSEAVRRSLEDFGRLLEGQRGSTRRRVPALRPNHASVVVWVRVGQHRMLLGADLEVHTDDRLGWQAIIRSRGRPRDRAGLYKVAHHGSPNGDCPEIWTELLAEQPVACLTPFTRGPTPRPQPEDLTRLCGQAIQVYVTAARRRPPSRRRPAPVERTIREVVGELRHAEPSTGAVRLRPSDGGEPGWDAELFSAAFEACSGRTD